MEVQFTRRPISCLRPVLGEVQNLEQTHEMKLPENMPDIGRVLAAWAQPVLRGKEWLTDRVAMSGGMQVWVLYCPEDGTQVRCMDCWIPFQIRWDLPEGTKEGKMTVQCVTRFVDARSVSPRKIIVRMGVGALAQGYAPEEISLYVPENVPEGVELLRSTYPVRLPREAGEKTFSLDEDLSVPPSVPRPEKLVYYTLKPEIQDQKVLGNKVVFRGNGNLHVLFLSEEGQLHSWDFELPISQFDELNGNYSTEALAEVILSPTNVELDLDEEGNLRLRCGLVGQYLVTEPELISLVEDAYSPGRELNLSQEQLDLPAVLETRRENLYGEQTIPGEANIAADVQFLPDFPRQRRIGDRLELEMPGSFQVLYYGDNGTLQSANGRWTGELTLDADENSRILARPTQSQAQVYLGNDSMIAKGEVPLQMTTTGTQGLQMVTGLQLGEAAQPLKNRPSLILKRAGEHRLWDIAKATGTTVEAIRKANGLQDEPLPNQMLLIPVH